MDESDTHDEIFTREKLMYYGVPIMETMAGIVNIIMTGFTGQPLPLDASVAVINIPNQAISSIYSALKYERNNGATHKYLWHGLGSTVAQIAGPVIVHLSTPLGLMLHQAMDKAIN